MSTGTGRDICHSPLVGSGADVHKRVPRVTGRRPSPSSRREGKELTRQALLRAALKLLSRNSFDSISLREVTREAGISPTAFYRHFDGMEELGLVLVEESFGSLRQMLRSEPKDSSTSTRPSSSIPSKWR